MLTVASVGDLRVGDLGFASIKGRVGAGVLAGQTAIDLAALIRGRRVENAGWITHAYMVTHVNAGADLATLVEAMPRGARQGTIIDQDRVGVGFAYVRLPDDVGGTGWQDRAASAARSMVDVPYGFAQYGAIAALTLSGGPLAASKGWLARYVDRRDPGTGLPVQVICSQLVDEALRLAGVHLFHDARPPQYVTPGSLFWRVAQIGEVCVCG